MSQENKQPEPIKEYYIAYFDLLGYKQFFQTHPDKAGDFLQAIHEAVSNTGDYIQAVNSSRIGVEIGKLFIRKKVFSDNILLCLETTKAEVEYPRFLAFLAIIADIQRNFVLRYGLSLRGGITIGELSFNEDFVFGRGLIDAVTLEETAIYPRIIMDKSVLDYVRQPHFVKQDDLKKACEIENHAHSGEYISDEELAFCNSVMPAVNMERFYLQWRDHLLFPVVDGAVVLNYLYCLNVSSMFDQTTIEQIWTFLEIFSPNDYQQLRNLSPSLNQSDLSSVQKQRLEQHKTYIIQKINEFGKYDDLDISKVKEADTRERILKKYLWTLTFHNNVCIVYGIPDCMIKSGSTFDVRFMKMSVAIFEDSPSLIKQQERNQDE